MLKLNFFLKIFFITLSIIKTINSSKCLNKNNDKTPSLITCITNDNSDNNKVVNNTFYSTIIFSTLIDNNTNETTTLDTIIVDNRTDDNNDINNKIETETETEVDCCLLTIIRESEGNIIRCIEIKNDEDEIEKRIDAFKIMFKNAEEISINCSYKYIKFKLLKFILFSLIFIFI